MGGISTYNTNEDVQPASQTITAFDTVTASFVGANGQTFYSGTPTAGSAAVFPISSIETVVLQANLLGAGGTMVVEVSSDGGTFWLRPNVHQISTQSYTNSFTSPFQIAISTVGLTNVRVRGITSWTGTATIIVREATNTRVVTVGDSLPGGANTIGSLSNISGTISLPTGAATSANQVTENASLSSIDTKLTSQATAANQTTGNASLSSIDTKLSSQATAANQTTEITALQLIDNPVGSVAPGTAGTSSYLTGSIYNTSAPSASNGQQLATQADVNGKIKTVDICDGGGLAAALTVGTSAVLACAGGAATNLTNRKHLSVHNNGIVSVYWGTANTVTTSSGTPIVPGAIAIFTVGANTSIYLISGTASQNTRVAELA